MYYKRITLWMCTLNILLNILLIREKCIKISLWQINLSNDVSQI